MHAKFKEMMAKKRDLSPNEKHAKMGVLKDLKHSLADEAGSRLEGMKKVSVMSDSDQGLKHGLDKAKELADQSPDSDEMDQMSDGGPVVTPVESGQESLRKAFHFSEGGEVDAGPKDESNEPAEEGENHQDEFEGLDMDALKQKLRHLMRMHTAIGK